MPLTAKEAEHLNHALNSIQAELGVYQTLLFCFLVNTMAATGKMSLLDDLIDQAKFLIEHRQPTGISAAEAEHQRQWTLDAFDRVLENLHQARAAMERTGNPDVN